jgi:hypothetical protein
MEDSVDSNKTESKLLFVVLSVVLAFLTGAAGFSAKSFADKIEGNEKVTWAQQERITKLETQFLAIISESSDIKTDLKEIKAEMRLLRDAISGKRDRK